VVFCALSPIFSAFDSILRLEKKKWRKEKAENLPGVPSKKI
jgi:hypothetical protein